MAVRRGDGGFGLVRPVPIQQFRDEALALSAKRSVWAAGGIRRVLRLAEELGATTTADLSPELLERLVSKLRDNGLSEVYINDYIYKFRRVCNLALELGRLAASPFDSRPDLAPKFIRQVDRDRGSRFRSPAQLKALMDYLEARSARSFHDHRLFVMAAVVVYTGAGTHDVTMLRPGDVDLNAQTIRFSHRDRRVKLPAVVPIPPKLSSILEGWLKRPFEPGTRLRRLNASQAAEAIKLRSEGWKTSDLADRFGVSQGCIKDLLSGRSYAHVPRVGGPPPRAVAEMEWLFPSGESGGARPFTWHKNLIEAGKAVGVDRLRVTDLRYIFKRVVLPTLVTLRPDRAAPLPEISPVLLGGPGTPPVVLGRQKPPLSPSEFAVVRALLDVFPGGRTWPKLKEVCGYEPRIVVRRLKENDPDWDAVLLTPKDSPYKDCRIVVTT